MKGPILCSMGIVALGTFLGVREQGVVSELREQRRLLALEAERLGIPADASGALVSGSRSKRQREDSNRKAKDFAGKLVAFAKEMKEAEKSGKPQDEVLQRRIMDLVDGMLALDANELKILITELRGRSDMDDDMRKGMIGFSIMMLAQDHPEKALAIFTESSDLLDDNPMRNHVLTSALTQWAKDQPLAAVEWMRNNAVKYPDLIDGNAKRAVIEGAAGKGFGLALQIASDLKIDLSDDALVPMLAKTADTPERRNELLSLLRNKAAGMTDRDKADALVKTGVFSIFSQISETGYDKAMTWLDGAGLSAGETADIASCLNYRSTKGETGRWLDWVGTRADAKTAPDTTRNLMRDWTRNDYKAAGEWLAAAPAGPNKETAVLSYAETVAPYDPEVAAQWAETLTGSRKDDAMKRIVAVLKAKDPIAAGEFAARHGLPAE